MDFVLVNYNQPGSVSYIQQPPSSLPVAMIQLTDRYPQQSFNVYRRFPNPIQQQQQQQINNIPSYSNGASVQIYDQTNFNNQQQSSAIVQNPNPQQLTLQIRRERQRRAIIDKIVLIFDEDGLFFCFLFQLIFFYSIGNGQLTKDELYSMALRSNMFPKFHYYLKQTSA